MSKHTLYALKTTCGGLDVNQTQEAGAPAVDRACDAGADDWHTHEISPALEFHSVRCWIVAFQRKLE